MPVPANSHRPNAIRRALHALTRQLHRRRDRRRIDQLRRDPYLARDIGLPPLPPVHRSALYRRTDLRSRW